MFVSTEQERTLKVFPVKKDRQRSVFIRVAHDQTQNKGSMADEVQNNGMEQV